MNKVLIHDILVGIISLLCIATFLYKEKIISFIPNSLLHPSKLIKQIIAAFFVIFIIGTITFIITVRYFSLETLNSYFYLLSSLTTIFAALVAVFVTQDFRQQKRMEYLSKTASHALKYTEKLKQHISNLTIEFSSLNNTVKFSETNIQEISEKIKKFQEKYNKNFPENERLVAFDLYYHTGLIYRAVSTKDRKKLQNCCNLMSQYGVLLEQLNVSIAQEYIDEESKETIKKDFEKNDKNELLNQINIIEELFKNYITYT